MFSNEFARVCGKGNGFSCRYRLNVTWIKLFNVVVRNNKRFEYNFISKCLSKPYGHSFSHYKRQGKKLIEKYYSIVRGKLLYYVETIKFSRQMSLSLVIIQLKHKNNVTLLFHILFAFLLSKKWVNGKIIEFLDLPSAILVLLKVLLFSSPDKWIDIKVRSVILSSGIVRQT